MDECLQLEINGTLIRIPFPAICYVKAADKYVRIVSHTQFFLIRASMNTIEKLLPVPNFCRIHRSYIISIDHLSQYKTNAVNVGAKQLPVGRRYRAALRKQVYSRINQQVYSRIKQRPLHVFTDGKISQAG
jgi:DNA-binding LytR/AlgR family response regulator